MFVNDFLKLNKFTYFGVLSVVSQKGLSGQKQGLTGGGLGGGAWHGKFGNPCLFFIAFLMILFLFFTFF